MGKKRLVINLEETDHVALVKSARDANVTVSNYVRNALGFSPERQGVKTTRAAAVKKAPAKRAKK